MLSIIDPQITKFFSIHLTTGYYQYGISFVGNLVTIGCEDDLFSIISVPYHLLSCCLSSTFFYAKMDIGIMPIISSIIFRLFRFIFITTKLCTAKSKFLIWNYKENPFLTFRIGIVQVCLLNIFQIKNRESMETLDRK